MPELPDVENFKYCLENTCLSKSIVDISTTDKNLIKKITFKDFRNKLIGHKFKSAFRRGKFLIVEIDGIPEKLVIHFGMTGDFQYVRSSEKPSLVANVTFKFDDNSELRWLNRRKLGKIYLVKELADVKLLKQMGPEPLKLSKKDFLDLLAKNENMNIKAFMLDQTIIAGIGNVYSDEILYQSKINPHKKIKDLSKQKRDLIYEKMKKILKDAPNYLSKYTPEGLVRKPFPKSWLISSRYQMKCPLGHKLKRETIAGRPARWCPVCQK